MDTWSAFATAKPADVVAIRHDARVDLLKLREWLTVDGSSRSTVSQDRRDCDHS